MLIPLFYTLNIIILLSGLFSTRFKTGKHIFSIALLRCLLGIPLLALEYYYLTYHFELQAVELVFFSEIIFSLLWIFLAYCLQTIPEEKSKNPAIFCATAFLVTTAAYFLTREITLVSNTTLSFSNYSPEYFSAIFILAAVLFASWRLEEFWRRLNTSQRWDYKLLLIGFFIINGTLLWSASYRLTYLHLPQHHFLLLTALLLSGWILSMYGVISHRLLNRKIFISRKIVYSSVVPSLLAAYLLGLGIISLVMNTFSLELSYVLKWLLLIFGCIAIGLFAFSKKFQRHLRFFISTNFYINKYEYRDEWLALSQELQGAFTEDDVVSALCHILSESLYTSEIFIWIGEPAIGYRLAHSPVPTDINDDKFHIGGTDPLTYYILSNGYFHMKEENITPTWQHIADEHTELLKTLYITLVTPITVGDHPVGFIGLGPEFSNGVYGRDDFDLLTAIGSQTASALMAVQIAEKLAHAREQEAWNRLSTFVLHDIKNAASMLSLLQENAPAHIHEPEFQQDMLELIDDSLNRMGRVEQRLQSLKDEIVPDFQSMDLNGFLKSCCDRLATKLPLIEISFEQQNETLPLQSDPELLLSIFENLLINALEAQRDGIKVSISTKQDIERDLATVKIFDNGPGIDEELLPDVLFKPFKTNKKSGSGIGLWQVNKVLLSLKGSVSAKNAAQGGAQFTITLPLSSSVE